jgi:hypothetical protein
MKVKPKIKISEAAYNNLINLIKDSEYEYVRFIHNIKKCGVKIEIILDNFKPNDITDKIEDLNILYNSDFNENIVEITLVYRNDMFMIKASSIENLDINSECVGCSSKKDGCNKENCGGYNNC